MTPPRADPHRHIVDELLAERAPRLLSSPLWPMLGPLRNALFGYRRACRMADAIGPLDGQAAIDHVSELLHLQVTHTGRDEHVPASGRCVLIANHPTGIADGIAVYDALRERRADVRFFANADALRICPGFRDVLIPVAWPASKRTVQSSRLTLAMAREALREERALVIFAAGVMSRRVNGVLQDPPWESSAVALARRYAAPVVPVHVAGPNSFLFHLFGRFSQELRNITLFHELMNKAGKHYHLIFGPPLDATQCEQPNALLTSELKHHVEQVLPVSPTATFR